MTQANKTAYLSGLNHKLAFATRDQCHININLQRLKTRINRLNIAFVSGQYSVLTTQHNKSVINLTLTTALKTPAIRLFCKLLSAKHTHPTKKF